MRFWKWNEDFNYSKFKLGEGISELIENKTLIKDSINSSKFHVISGLPEYIIVESNKISSIFFEKKFLQIDEFDIWNMRMTEFIRTMDDFLEPCEHNFRGDVLTVLFRDVFTGYAEVKRNEIILSK